MSLLSKIPFIRRLLYRRHFAVVRAEQEAWRWKAAEHNAAVARILAQGRRVPDGRRSLR